MDRDNMVDLMGEGYPWIHKDSVAYRKEQNARPIEDIHPLDYITVEKSP